MVFFRYDSADPAKRPVAKLSRACVAVDLPKVSFHGLRHTHASALIAAGLDAVAASKRLGHGSATTLDTYRHLFRSRDDVAAV